MIAYEIQGAGQTLVFTGPVLKTFSEHRQLRFWQREAGGQLFGHFQGATIEVVEATGPRRTDRRTRTSYIPDRRAEQREIDERFRRGLHFIGDWHSHPEKRVCIALQSVCCGSLSNSKSRSRCQIQQLALSARQKRRPCARHCAAGTRRASPARPTCRGYLRWQ
jgi:integrative and conjugative element protein (TIGR02256 family)